MAVSPLLLLASCGGGGSGGTSAGSPVVAPTTPTIPTPPVSPPPSSPVYAAAFAFDRDQQFLGQGVELNTIFRYDATAPLSRVESVSAVIQPNRTGTEFRFTAASSAATVRYNSDTSNLVSADINSRSDSLIAWSRGRTFTERADLFVVTKPAVDYGYVNLVRQSIGQVYAGAPAGSATQGLERYYLFGSRTVDSDIPRTGAGNYQTVIVTTPANAGGSGLTGTAMNPGTLRIDHASGTLAATIPVIQAGTVAGTPPETATLMLAGRFGSDGYTGTISSADGRYSGSFAGDLFGPAGVEVGFVLVLNRIDGTKLVGILTARRS